ncbi:EAL domain-containing protein [Sphaerotilus mobilis]|uniref:PAS domain S-box-containing protein/diguanylate cyclase (GGDEF)-like protein n=1 Tax=Sphaerotilus mobilis TaxID=47994 RepID=A0A4Q7LDK0_9BURK|nr:EAL domain-containing protein [Sphaerotilus mobilis]RZS52072.1 PAS domain S-box-containing protein/diguanylate cyclase (GGDEF)-like protein [Sphaerotilus mobilis]
MADTGRIATVDAPDLAPLARHWLRLDANGHVLALSPALAADAASVAPVIGQPFAAALVPASQLIWAVQQWPTLKRQGVLQETLLELAGAGPDRSPWPVTSTWCVEPGRTPPSFIGLLTPGHERQRLMADLKRARSSLDAIPGALLQIELQPDRSLRFPYASSTLLELFGVTPTQVASNSQLMFKVFTPDSQGRLVEALLEATTAGASTWKVILTLQRQPRRRLELVARRSPADLVWHGLVTDVSEREQLQTELREQAETDPLTRLANRPALMALMRSRLQAGQPFAVLFMDCDRFKQVNDSLGHDAGDDLLRQMARRLRQGLRPIDDLAKLANPAVAAGTSGSEAGPVANPPGAVAARLGGDEFVVLADGIASTQAVAALADRLVQLMAKPYKLREMELVATVSVGVVLAQPGNTAEDLLRNADTAMYEAKGRARGHWVMFEPAMHARAVAALALESDLRTALRTRQLRVAYQPIVEIATGRVVGMEALARWRHPLKGEISPATFIPVAESTGLIAELGEFILVTACQQFADWQRHGLAVPPRLSVNLSSAQLADLGLPERIRQMLEDIELPGSALQLEITESLATSGPTVERSLAMLRAQGIRLALDDFGTGHSSLASLQQLPVQQVKIDRAFVSDIEHSAYHRALVQAVVKVAHSLSLDVVAEGVETLGQARMLAELGCPRAQGWLYARALEADAVPALLSAAGLRVLNPPSSDQDVPVVAHRGFQVVVTDPQGLTVHVNTAFSINTGYTLSEMLGRTPGSVLQRADADTASVRRLRDALRTGAGCIGVEIVNYRKDGTAFDTLIDIEPVRDADGRIVQFVSVQTEVSELRRQQRELSDLRQRLQDVRSLGQIGFVERDAITGTGLGDANALSLFGLGTDQATPDWRDLRTRVQPDTLADFDRYVDDVRGGIERGTCRFRVGSRLIQLQWTRRGQRLLETLVDVGQSGRG